MEHHNEIIERELLAQINWSKKTKIWLGFLVLLLITCLYFYFVQIRDGLGVTGMHDFVSWGIYISNFVFFVATSLVGMLIGSVMGLLNFKWVEPISRIAEIVAVSFAIVAGIVIVTDMGRPDRLHHVFLYGRVQSPIILDIAVVITYVAISLLVLYIPLIPDLPIYEKNLKGLPKFQRKLYRILSLGWANTEEQFKLLKKYLRILLVLMIPIALAIHTVTSWLFAMTLRPGWDSPIFGPYFVSGAFVAGSAAVIIAMYVFRKVYKLDKYITDEHFDKMGKLLVMVALVYVYFNINEIIVPAYKLKEGESTHLTEMLVGRHALYFWLVQFGGLVLPFLLMVFKFFRRPLPSMILSTIILIGAWFKRYLIVVPIQMHPYLPIQNVPDKYYGYMPTLPEIMITLLSFVLVVLIITILSKLFTVVPIWEVKESLVHKKEEV